jgi:hypothetical protein
MKNLIHDWQTYWTIFFSLFVLGLVIPDIIAVRMGHKRHLGDQLTFTHWLVVYIGLSALGAFAGYFVIHFFFVHKKG